MTYTSSAMLEFKQDFLLLLVPLETVLSVENAHLKNNFLISKQQYLI